MDKKEQIILTGQVERDFLPFVRKPARYIGGEINQVRKDVSKCRLTAALCFPDVYEVAMSYTGIAILYDILNKIEDVAAERVFTPWTDAEQILRQKNIPLFSLESKLALKSFDIAGFSMTSELCYTNVLNMLDLGGLKLRSRHRGETDPLIIAGGGMANCCEPMAEFIDIFLLGECEEAIVELVQFVKTAKSEGLSKKDILLQAACSLENAYVPCLYTFEYDNAKIKSFKPLSPGLRTNFKNAAIHDFENASFPLRPIVPFVQSVHERVSIEIMRGCPGRCRFCQASFSRRPLRHRSAEKIIDIAKRCYQATGFDTVSLLSLSTADYPHLEPLVSGLQEYFQDKHVGLSLPSLHVSQQLKLLPKLVTSVRKSGLTIAVESASEKIRQIINKPLKDKDLFAAVEAAYQAGWQQFKLYFMVGLPGETDSDIEQIVHLSFQLAQLRKKISGKTAQINVTISWFVPKPHTPFGWLAQRPKEYFEHARRLILAEKKKLYANFLQFKFHDIDQSVLESATGRGDRRLCDVIEAAWQSGAKFDLWSEHFNNEIWQNAFKKFGLDIETFSRKQFGPDEILPWEHLGGPDKKYLLTHLDEAMKLCPPPQGE